MTSTAGLLLLTMMLAMLLVSGAAAQNDNVPPQHHIEREAEHFQLPPAAHRLQHHEQYASFLGESHHTHHVPVGLPGHEFIPEEGHQLLTIILARHGDRTPVYLYENTISTWPEGSGQLTGLGMKQQHDLGAMMRKRYIEERQLIEPYWRLDQVYARSTSRTRTLQSAISFFTGFFPPGTGPNLPEGEGGGPALPINLQPVPIMSATRYNDTLLYAYKNCPRLKRLIKENRKSSEWVQKAEENKELLDQLSEILGEPISLKQMTSIKTLLNAERIHGKPQLPGITADMISKIHELGEWAIKRKFETHEMGKLAAGALPDEIRNRMRNMIIDHYEIADEAKAEIETSPKDVLSRHSYQLKKTYSEPAFVFFAGHDGTILALLSALRAQDIKVPYFSSFLTFELYAPLTEEPPFVKLWYDDQPLLIPGCAHKCTFSEFSAVIDNSYEPDWLRACDIEWLRPIHEGCSESDTVAQLQETIQAQAETIQELQAALDYKKYKKELKKAEKEVQATDVEKKSAADDLKKSEKKEKKAIEKAEKKLEKAEKKAEKKLEKAEKKAEKE